MKTQFFWGGWGGDKFYVKKPLKKTSKYSTLHGQQLRTLYC